MKRLWIAIVVLTCATVGHAGKAEAFTFLTGAELLETCESDSVTNQSVCTGFLMGINDITQAYDTWGDLSKEFCIPVGVGTSQLEKVVIKGLNERPEKLHLTASSQVVIVFKKAFPCD